MTKLCLICVYFGPRPSFKKIYYFFCIVYNESSKKILGNLTLLVYKTSSPKYHAHQHQHRKTLSQTHAGPSPYIIITHER